jgi:hypothetical protein
MTEEMLKRFKLIAQDYKMGKIDYTTYIRRLANDGLPKVE